MISVKNVSKTFKVSRRNAGFGEAAKALFHREYEYVKALDGISFEIDAGEMVGYIGPNGAGKSSTIKVLSGILTPDSGECIVNGRVPYRERAEHVKNIGVVFGQRSQLWWDVPVVDSFLLLKDIYGIDDRDYRKNYEELVTLLSLEKIIRTPTRQLSLGQRMRCEIAASLLHNPQILFLDEPTIGLDAVSKIAVRNFIQQINKERKTTVILTTHDMADIEALTSRILLVGKGKILRDGELNEIKKQYSQYKTLTVDYNGGSYSLCEGMRLVEDVNRTLVISIDTVKLSASQAISHLSNTLDITDISVTGTSIEDMVVSLYEEFHI